MALKLTKVEFKNGLSFSPTPITVIVGANNTGKTRLLKEINSYVLGNTEQEYEYAILKSIQSDQREFDTVIASLGIKSTSMPEGGTLSFLLNDGFFELVNLSGDKNYFDTMKSDLQKMTVFDALLFRKQFGKAITAFIQTETRLLAAKSSRYEDNTLLSLFYNNDSEVEDAISDVVYNAFDVDIKLDYSVPGRLSIRIGDDFSEIPPDPRDARELLSKFPLLEDQGDGIRSFTTTLLILMLTRRPIVLIDEPEAFLHPPQAATLATTVSKVATDQRSIIVATHSSDFLRGIIANRQDVNILRLNRNDKETTAHLIDASQILKIIKSPLLNSSRVLDGLFYRGVVVMEGDSDRAFYERIAKLHFAADEILYLHAHNKQTIYKIMDPYVMASVKCAVIVDFDVLRDKEDLKRILETSGQSALIAEVGELQQKIQEHINSITSIAKYKALMSEIGNRLGKETDIDLFEGNKDDEAEARRRKLKSDITKFFDESDKWSVFKRKGREALIPEVQVIFDKLNSICNTVGIFIVVCGSLESWLETHGVSPSLNNKAHWIGNALTWLNDNDPTPMPVRDFVGSIHDYINQ